jgi:hypothetical protein
MAHSAINDCLNEQVTARNECTLPRAASGTGSYAAGKCAIRSSVSACQTLHGR